MLKQFFIICSGADTDILAQCSKGEQNKYAGIGATVFFTALMASIAGSYALYTVFDNVFIAIGFGIVWGLLIFNLDRYIVSTIKKTGNVTNEILQASPRLILAIIIAVVISKPLELKIFEKEINHALLEQNHALTLANKNQIAEQFTPTITALENEKEALQQEIITKETEVNALYDTYIAEAEGVAGTKLRGKGPVYKEKRDKHDMLLTELQQLKTENKTKIQAIEAEIASQKATYNTQVENTQPVINNIDGLMARIQALGTLPWFPSFFIFLLFLAIETSPIIVKLLASKGVYDLKLEDYENTVKIQVLQNKSQREAVFKTEGAINDKVYQDLEDEGELYTYKRKKTKALMQLQADVFFENQKNVLG